MDNFVHQMLLHRQVDLEGGTLALDTGDSDGTAMVTNDLLRNGQTEACALLFCRKKRIEKTVANGCWNAGPVVRHFNDRESLVPIAVTVDVTLAHARGNPNLTL